MTITGSGGRWLGCAALAAALLAACGDAGDGTGAAGGDGVRGTAAVETAACERARERDGALVDRFVGDWAPVLLEPAGQRQVLVAGPLPPQLQPAQYGDLSPEEQLGLTSCLARRLAETRPATPPDVVVDSCSAPCVDVYRDSLIASTGTPLEAGLLRVVVFDRDSGMLPDPSVLVPEPLPPPAVPAP